MSNYQEARDFYDAFQGRTWRYSSEVRMSIQNTAHEIWEYVISNSVESKFKKEFVF